MVNGTKRILVGKGNGPIDAFVHALHESGLPPFELLKYSEHSLDTGAKRAAIQLNPDPTSRGAYYFGADDTNIEPPRSKKRSECGEPLATIEPV